MPVLILVALALSLWAGFYLYFAGLPPAGYALFLASLGLLLVMWLIENKKRKAADEKVLWWGKFSRAVRHNYRNQLQMISALAQMHKEDKMVDYIQEASLSLNCQHVLVDAGLFRTLLELESFPDPSRLQVICDSALPYLFPYDQLVLKMVRSAGTLPGQCRFEFATAPGGCLVTVTLAGNEGAGIPAGLFPASATVLKDGQNCKIQLYLPVKSKGIKGILTGKSGFRHNMGG